MKLLLPEQKFGTLAPLETTGAELSEQKPVSSWKLAR